MPLHAEHFKPAILGPRRRGRHGDSNSLRLPFLGPQFPTNRQHFKHLKKKREKTERRASQEEEEDRKKEEEEE
jgi:hypothetical protein